MLSLILPTYTEAGNLHALVKLLTDTLSGIAHEIIIVDDNSPDGTWRVAQHLASRYPSLRVIRRIDKRGLSSAVVDGFDAARGEALAVMDADGQHDAGLLLLLKQAFDAGADIAIGSRYMPGGSVGAWVRDRRILSRVGTALSNRLSSHRVSDPLSGFFLIRKSMYETIRGSVRPSGFKILLELLAHLPKSAVVREVPLVFRPRMHGTSKLSLRVHIAFCLQILRLGCKRFLRPSASMARRVFCIVSVLLAIAFSLKAYALLPLYLSQKTRTAVTEGLTILAEREGVLLSDIRITRVTSKEFSFVLAEKGTPTSPSKHCTFDTVSHLLSCDERSSL